MKTPQGKQHLILFGKNMNAQELAVELAKKDEDKILGYVVEEPDPTWRGRELGSFTRHLGWTFLYQWKGGSYVYHCTMIDKDVLIPVYK